jgi:hypothetical protein
MRDEKTQETEDYMEMDEEEARKKKFKERSGVIREGRSLCVWNKNTATIGDPLVTYRISLTELYRKRLNIASSMQLIAFATV